MAKKNGNATRTSSNPNESSGNGGNGGNGVGGIHLFSKSSNISNNEISESNVAGGNQSHVSNAVTNEAEEKGFIKNLMESIMTFLRILLLTILLLVTGYTLYLLFQGKLTWQEFIQPFMNLVQYLFGLFSS